MFNIAQKRMALFVIRILIHSAIYLDLLDILAKLLTRFVKKIDSDGSCSALCPNISENTITILVLDYVRFRGDVEIFVKTGKVNCLNISYTLLQIMFEVFFPKKVLDAARKENSLGERWDFLGAEKGSELYKYRENYRGFLYKFLPIFFDFLNVDLVLNSDNRYRRQADFSMVASYLNYPHICHYREAMYIVPAHYKNAVERHNSFGRFEGDIMAVQNEVTKQTFIDSGSVSEDTIVIRGCPRMDEFIRKINFPAKNAGKTKQATFFSFPKGAQLEDLSFFYFFHIAESIVRVIAKLANNNRDIDFVIRLKDLHFKGKNCGQIGIFREIIRSEFDGDEPPNIKFSTDKMGAQQLILDSGVIIAMQSTTVLEAGIAGKPVILPHYKKLMETPRVHEVLMYQEYHELFDVPADENQLEEMIIHRLNYPYIPPSVISKRKVLFEKHVSYLDSNSTQKCIDMFTKLKKKRDTKLQENRFI